MSTKRCQRVHGTEPPPAWESCLAVDLLLEIVARTDVTTVVRSAATCRLLRRAILEPASRSRLALQLAADDGTGSGFDPALLLGVSYQEYDDRKITTYRIIHTPAPNQLRARLDAGSLRDSFRPVASRDRLLLLDRRYGVSAEPLRRPYFDLRVCDVLTGHVTELPPVYVSYAFQHVFLCIGDGDAGASFELLFMVNIWRFQTFSSKEGRWGAVREASLPSHHPNTVNWLGTFRPAVLGRTVYWSCCTSASVCWDKILALDVDAAKARFMELPPGCYDSNSSDIASIDKSHLLASVRGRLSLFISDLRGIWMWTLTPALSGSPAKWNQRLVIGVLEIQRQVGNLVCAPFNLKEFGERSGTVIFHLDCGELFRLDLGTKEERPVVRRIKCPGSARVTGLFLHETDLISLLQAMKSV